MKKAINLLLSQSSAKIVSLPSIIILKRESNLDRGMSNSGVSNNHHPFLR